MVVASLCSSDGAVLVATVGTRGEVVCAPTAHRHTTLLLHDGSPWFASCTVVSIGPVLLRVSWLGVLARLHRRPAAPSVPFWWHLLTKRAACRGKESGGGRMA
jgi:hypothetical protein